MRPTGKSVFRREGRLRRRPACLLPQERPTLLHLSSRRWPRRQARARPVEDRQRAPRDKLIESILTPSKEIAPLFVAWNIITSDGKTHTGLIVEEGSINGKPGTVTLADAEGKIKIIKRQDIEERHALATSIMPDNLAEQMTPREFVDLIEYLGTLEVADGLSRSTHSAGIAAGNLYAQGWRGLHLRSRIVFHRSSAIEERALEAATEDNAVDFVRQPGGNLLATYRRDLRTIHFRLADGALSACQYSIS